MSSQQATVESVPDDDDKAQKSSKQGSFPESLPQPTGKSESSDLACTLQAIKAATAVLKKGLKVQPEKDLIQTELVRLEAMMKAEFSGFEATGSTSGTTSNPNPPEK